MALGVAKKPAVDLAIVMGPRKGKPELPHGRGHMDHGPDDGEEDAPDSETKPGEGGEELPPGFEEAFSEVFPEAADDREKMQALKRLIHLCTDSY